MKFACKTIINLPINKVVELFMDKSNYKYWKKVFTGFEPLSGISTLDVARIIATYDYPTKHNGDTATGR
jgi:hypothetical protein